jgi:hypothetical protein
MRTITSISLIGTSPICGFTVTGTIARIGAPGDRPDERDVEGGACAADNG